MFPVLRLVLIIFFNITYAYITQLSEIILLPTWNPTDAKEIPLTLKVFGKLIQLNLRKTDQIVSPAFEIWKYNVKGVTKKLSLLKESDSCFYFHEDHISSAVINFCQEDGLEGLVFVENDILEIQPLRNKFTHLSLPDDFYVKEQINLSFGKPHLIKKSQKYFADSNLYHWNNLKPKQRHIRSTQQKLTIKLGVFFDEEAYHTFMPLLDNDKEKVHCMILLYVNCIQAALHHPSLGVSIDISLVHLDITEKQPLDLPVVDKDYNEMLKLFCEYAESRNSPDDNDPHHWDIGLYITGTDLYQPSKLFGSMFREYGPYAVSYIHGACISNHSCVVVELLAASEVMSSGLRSCSSGAHEIGHLLGLPHDVDSVDTKPGDGLKYIMSGQKTDKRQIAWSEGSRNKTKELWEKKTCLQDDVRRENFHDAYVFDNLHYHNSPGREWTAKAQCEVFLRDEDANVVTLYDICQILQCETPHKNTYFFTGPALDGTYCALGKECRNGECVPVIEPPYIFKYCDENDYSKWSEWKEDSCKSSCLIKSKGVLAKRRFCEYQTHRIANCSGPYFDVVLCDDSTLCTEDRKTIDEFTAIKCTLFSSIMSELKKQSGWQAPYEGRKPWKACTIFCLEGDTYYAPQLEMLYYGIDPYFPDGTWCHQRDGQNYYCRQHQCLPEDYSFEKEWSGDRQIV